MFPRFFSSGLRKLACCSTALFFLSANTVFSVSVLASDTIAGRYFVEDNGEYCSIFFAVSTPEEQDKETAVRLISDGFATMKEDPCSLSKLEDVAVVTVGELDNYQQPNWSSVVEHFFYVVSDADAVWKNCLPATEGAVSHLQACVDTLNKTLVEK